MFKEFDNITQSNSFFSEISYEDEVFEDEENKQFQTTSNNKNFSYTQLVLLTKNQHSLYKNNVSDEVNKLKSDFQDNILICTKFVNIKDLNKTI